MSTSFEARFSTTSFGLPKLLERLEAILPSCGLRFFGSVMPLQSSHGWPTVSSVDFSTVESLAAAADLASKWWGIGIECVSDVLLEGLGRSDAVEVYFNVFRAPGSRWTLNYVESSSATDHRIESEEAACHLSALQMAVCEAGCFEWSIYEEQDHERDPVPTLRNVEVALKRIAADPQAGDLSAVVSSKLIDYKRGRRLAGPRADQVKLSASGYVLFPFLVSVTSG